MIQKILIVDDSPVARKMIRRCIPEGLEVYEASNGKEGVDKFKEVRPDVTFMDLTMPVMTGYQAIRDIISFDSNAIIVVITADVQMKSIKRVLDLGAYSVLKKPVKKDQIEQVLYQIDKIVERVG